MMQYITYFGVAVIAALVILAPIGYFFRETLLRHVPFTKTRANAKLQSGLNGLIGDHDVLVGYETEDGLFSLTAADYDVDAGLYETTKGWWVIPRGDGQVSSRLMGTIPFIYAHEAMPGAVSAEASVIGRAIEDGETATITPDGGTTHGLEAVEHIDLVRDIPIDAEDNSLRVAIQGSLLGAAKFAPFPVSEKDARTAAEWMGLAQGSDKSALIYFLMGAGAVLAIMVVFAVIMRIINSGGGGGGGIFMMLGVL